MAKLPTSDLIDALRPPGKRRVWYPLRELADYLHFPVTTLRRLTRRLSPHMIKETWKKTRFGYTHARWINDLGVQRMIVVVRAEQEEWNRVHPRSDFHLNLERIRRKSLRLKRG